MTEALQFALLGLGAGALYALLGQGLVLIFKGSGVLNLAHGAFAMAGAYLFYELHTLSGLTTVPAVAVVMLVLAAAGAVMDRLLLSRLRGASALTQLIGTLGIWLVVQALAQMRYGVQPLLVGPVLPQDPVSIFGATVASDRLWLVVIAVVLTAALTLAWRFTRVGWVMSAAAENERGAAALGWSPGAVSALTWALGAGLAGLAGVLIAPITQLSVGVLCLTVIPALAAALIGRFSSFWLTLAGGLGLGVAQSEVQHYVDLTGAATSIPFLVIVVVLAVTGTSLPIRGALTGRMPGVGIGMIRRREALAAVAVAALAIGFVLSPGWLSAVSISLAVAVVLLSIVVLTGYAGQLSLAQFALAGIGALAAARLVGSYDLAFPFAVGAGMLAATAVGLLFALPALRTRGVELAVVTLGLGAAAQAMVFSNSNLTGSASGTTIGSVSLLGLELDAAEHPVRYALLALLVFSLCVVAVANLRRGRSGRRLLAVRANERAAAALGISVVGAKLHAFALAGALAGLGGVIMAFRSTTVVYQGFGPLDSVIGVAQAVIGGVGYLLGPLVGASLAPGGVAEHVGGIEGENANELLPLVSGIVLLGLLMLAPHGVVDAFNRIAARLRRRGDSRSQPAALGDGAARRRVTGRPLVVRDLEVRYGGVEALSGLHLDLRPGTVTGLIGPNGAGKTSAVDAIAGFASFQGTIELGGEDISRWSAARRARAGLVRSFQSLELFEDMTVLENLQVAADRRDAKAMLTDLFAPGRPALPGVAITAAREFGLAAELDARVSEIGYGTRRLAAIARAVALEPSVLLLDEPAAGLDQSESQELAGLVRRLADDWGIAVLVIEHDMEFVMSLCDEVVVIDAGRPIASGTPAEVGTDRATIAAYLGSETAPANASKVAVPG